MEKYSWNFDEDAEFWYNDAQDTVEECIEDAKETIKENDEDWHDHVYVGNNIPFVPVVDAESVLEDIQERASEFVGEVADDWDAFNYKKHDELDELSNALSVVVRDWMKKYGYYPHFYAVENIKSYPLKSE